MKKALISAILFFVMLMGTAYAVPITYTFGGIINSDFGTLNAGSEFTGTFSYDPDNPHYLGINDDETFYGLDGFSITFGNTNLLMEGYDNRIGLTEDLIHGDCMGATSIATGNTTRLTLGGLQLGGVYARYFDDATGTALAGVGLPGADLTMTNFYHLAGFHLRQEGSTGINTYGWITSLQGVEHGGPAPVPEPATILLMSTGLAGLGFYKRKRNNKEGK